VTSWDVIIAGAGLAGICTALELREQRANVLLLDRGEPGREASSAAAGMLAPDDPETPLPLRPMAVESARLYPEFVRKLEHASNCTVDFRRQGAIVLGEKAPPRSYRLMNPDELHRIEPELKAGRHPAFFVAENTVDPVLLMRAAIRVAELSGIELRSGVAVQQMRDAGSYVEVKTDHGIFTAQTVVNCMGAWSGEPVRPRKGQMLNLQTSRRGLLEHVVRAPEVYLVPRSSGKILVGTTVEDVGFDKSLAPEIIRSLQHAAVTYIPELASATVSESWAGLRPGTPDNLPIIGPTAEPNVFIASGLFRNGILLAPLTGKIIADLVMQRPAPLDISAFSPARFARARASS
jgi:glycine oxidase